MTRSPPGSGSYALSRVSDTLLLRFQEGRADGSDWQGPRITLQEYTWFITELGFRIVTLGTFSPFYHEIVEVDLADSDDLPITLVGEYWPALMLGNMMFSRAGVHVMGSAHYIRKDIAEHSTLYWTFRRKNRQTTDRSRGWGSNSQWRTDFRRDYHIGSRYFYNVDGKYNLCADTLEPDDSELSRVERQELLVHRCFVTVGKVDDDLFSL